MDRYSGSEFAPFVTALGQFALAWNDLQYNLCELFSIVALERAPQPGDMVNYVPTYIWHAIKSDRSQRDMLQAAIKHSKLAVYHEKLIEDGAWLVAKVGSLEDRRNDIIHSSLIPLQLGQNSRTIVPNKFGKNPRAEKLDTAADLLKEIQSACTTAIQLSDYAMLLQNAVLSPRSSWPRKPALQGRVPKAKAAK
jgi:hypothetical protein